MREHTDKLNYYPLSKSQLNIWSLEQSFQGTSINNICETIRIQGTFDVVLLQKCLNLIVKADPSLRIQITLNENKVPVQYECDYVSQQFPVFDFSMTNQIGFECWENSITREVMPVFDAPLYYFAIVKIGEHEGGVLIKIHHLISDGWSLVSLINRISKTYLHLLNGNEEGEVLTLAPSYRMHVEEEQKYLSSHMFERDKAFWKEALSQISQPVALKECNNAKISPVGKRKTFALSKTLNHALSAYCTERRITPFTVFYMALAIYLKRIKKADHICIGVPIHNRCSFIDRQTNGMFVSTLPFYCKIEDNWTMEELNHHIADSWLDLLRHQKYPYSEIVAVSKEQNPNVSRLFHLVLSFHNSQAYHNRDTSILFSGQWHYAGYQAEHICIHLNNNEDERQYTVNYDYLTQLFSEGEIIDFHQYLIHIISQAITSPDKPISELSILGEEEQEKVLYSFNQTERFFYSGNLSEKLEEIYRANPYRVAVIQNGYRYTYEALWESSAKIASHIFNHILNGKKIVAILLPKSFELFSAMVGVIRSGCAWILLSLEHPKQRIEEIIVESQSAMILSSSNYIRQFHLADSFVPVFDINNLPELKCVLPVCPAEPEDLAYLIYTSGSTGKPKGVEIEQRSLLNFAEAMEPYYGKGAVLSLCNISFDAFLIESIVSLLNGKTVVLPMDKEQENPAGLAALIWSYAVGTLVITPSRLTAYLKNVDFLKAMKHLEAIICGGEAFPSNLLKVLTRCSNARIYNQYGPSETTIGISTRLLNTTSLISVGSPMQNCRCYVLDNNQKALPIGVFGELYIGGVCVGRGYHNAPYLTKEAFFINPFEAGERIYRTGDIAAWTENGEIVLKGREDGQVKIRGQRIELEEVASRLAQHPNIREAIVRLHDINGQPMMVAYYVAKSPVLETELLEFSATYLPEYMIPSIFIPIDEVPFTLNGKVDYHKLPIPVIHSEVYSEHELGEQTRAILTVFRRILNRSDVNASDDYFLFGGDSLNAMETITELEAIFGVRLRVADLYACRTAKRLEPLLGKKEVHTYITEEIRKAPRQESYPITPAQLGIYFETQMCPFGTAYNMPCGFKIAAKLNVALLNRTLKELVEQESILRTGFYPHQDGGCQRILDHAFISLECYETDTLQKAMDNFVRPFDLTCPPLLRMGYWEDENSSVILLDMHHIIGDGITASLLLKRISEIYCGKVYSKTELAFHDYAYWLKENGSKLVNGEKEYWQQQMSNAPLPPEIPTDFPRNKSFDYCGSSIDCSLNQEESRKCEEYCEQKGITPYMFFVGAFGILLSKLTNSNDMLVGIPVSNRRFKSLYEMAGLFVNTLPLRLTPQHKLTIGEYVKQVKESMLGLLDYPNMPLSELVAMSDKQRTNSQNPLFNTLISMRPVDTDHFTFDGMEVTPVPFPAKSAKFELNIEISKSHSCYHFHLEYASSLFEQDTISLYGRSLLTIIREMYQKDSCLVEDCNGISAMDHYHLMELPQALRVPFTCLSIDQQIDAMAMMKPNAPAIIFHDEAITFYQLKDKSDALAAVLMKEGVQVKEAVGILCKRGPELLIGMLAVLKVGGAYVPMLPSFPDKRLKYMMDISKITRVLCDSDTKEKFLGHLACHFIEITSAIEQKLVFTQPKNKKDNEICNILFTSGSTGQPKGVMIRHRSMCNLMATLYTCMSTVEGGFLCTANDIFDVFVTESLIAMAFGKYCVMADEEEMMLPWKSAKLVKNHKVRMIQFTPSRATLFFNNQEFFEAISNIPLAFLCGEALTLPLVQKLREANCQRIFNLYGPTEATVYVSMDEVTTADRITIGRIYPNCRGYILDERMRPVMPTAIGELYLAGECLSAGYIGRDDLTKEVFLPDPFFPGETMYRSGDIARLLPDGRIEYLGRRDHQVKLNGQRIELTEITQKIVDSNLVSQACTVVKKDGEYMTLRSFVQPKVGCAVDVRNLKSYLEKELPTYMIPSEIHVLQNLPCTPSGKIDLKALEQMEIIKHSTPDLQKTLIEEKSECDKRNFVFEDKAESEGTIEPAIINTSFMKEKESVITKEKGTAIIKENDTVITKELMLKLWKETLSVDTIDKDRSFFEQGGNSLAALILLSKYYTYGLSMTMADFYNHPTWNEHMKFFHVVTFDEITENVKSKDGSATKDISSNDAMNSNNYDYLKGEKNAVFLTGATGFFGAHIVRALMDAGYKKVYCLVRGENSSRLYETLSWYFGQGWLQSNCQKIESIQGNILKDTFGLQEESLNEIISRTAFVIHAAADVRHYAMDDTAERVNCEGTANVIAFAKKCNAKLVHISTISICGEYLLDAPQTVREFTEQDFEIGQNWRDNVYLRGKYKSENLVRQAKEEGLPVTIFRLGRLVGRDSDGVFQINASSNAFWQIVNAIVCLENISTDLAELPIELTAVDECAAAAVHLLNEKDMVYHLFNPNLTTVWDIVRSMNIPMTVVGRNDFEQHLREQLNTEYRMRIAPLLPEYTRKMQVPTRITPVCSETERVLLKHNFTWKSPDPSKLLRYFLQEKKWKGVD